MAVNRNSRYRKKFGTTGKGKDIIIVNVPNSNLFKVEFYPGGEVPDMLKGKWSDVPTLASKIQEYLNQAYKKATRFNSKARLQQQVKFQKKQADAARTLTAQVDVEECQE